MHHEEYYRNFRYMGWAFYCAATVSSHLDRLLLLPTDCTKGFSKTFITFAVSLEEKRKNTKNI